MKHFLKIMSVVLFVLHAAGTYAQEKTNLTNKMDNASEEYVTIDHGKTVEYTNNEWGYLMDEFTCTNGDKVSVDGAITKANGRTAKLSEGDKIYKDGHIVTASSKHKTGMSSKASGKSKQGNPPK